MQSAATMRVDPITFVSIIGGCVLLTAVISSSAFANAGRLLTEVAWLYLSSAR